MNERMPDHITDGPQTPEDMAEYMDKILKRLEYEPDQFDRDEAAEERE